MERKGKKLLKHFHHDELVDYHALPAYMKDNEFIKGSYRAEWPLKQAILSVFCIHNETLNIWTHLIGFLIFLGLTIYTAVQLPGVVALQPLQRLTENFQGIDGIVKSQVVVTRQPITRWPFFAFLGGAMFCLLASSCCHLLSCHSERLRYIMLRIDYTGIAALIATSFYPPVYYAFMCQPFFCYLYLGFITLFGIATMVLSLLPVFQKPQFRPIRTSLFFAMGASGFAPLVHKMSLYGNQPEAIQTTGYELTMGALYGLGGLIYVVRVPERWKPGRFDIVCSSHQLFHVLVVAAACVHYQAGLIYLKWRDAEGC